MSLLDKFDHTLTTEIGKTIADGVTGLVEGAAEDVQEFGFSIAADLMEAKLTGDDESEVALLDQLKVLAEINRIRVEAKAWIVIEKIVKTAFSVVLAAALAVV